MNSNGIRVRFAPSPTGHLHIGGARTALFNWLFARKTGGVFVLRIEDTDAERSTRESYEAILDALSWLGLDWDEGPDQDGAYGPYLQSARTLLYRNECEKLLASASAYRCFCTPQELEELRRERSEADLPPKYDGRCRRLPADEVEERVRNGVPHVVRFKLPEGNTRFFDIIRGEFNFKNQELDDFVLLKSDGRPTYNFAVVVDDAKMELTHIIRGDDHLSNTPRQVLLYQALDYKIPKFAHLPMILGSDRARLSKRHGAASVQEFRKLGYSPDAMLNYLALLGWSLDGQTEFFTRAALIEKFSLKRVTKNPAAFDMEKLKHINGEHFKSLGTMEKVAQVYDKLVDEKVLPPDFSVSEWQNGYDDDVERLADARPDQLYQAVSPRLAFIVNVMGNRLRGIADAAPMLAPFYKDDYARNSEAYSKHLGAPEVEGLLTRLSDAIAEVEPFGRADIERTVRALAEELGVKAGDLIHPCRVALTGQSVSPDIFAVIQLMGRDKCVERLRAAARHASGQTRDVSSN